MLIYCKITHINESLVLCCITYIIHAHGLLSTVVILILAQSFPLELEKRLEKEVLGGVLAYTFAECL